MKNHLVQAPVAAPAPVARAGWKKAVLALVGGVMLAATSGCVIAPSPYYDRQPQPVYVEPAYPSPGIGWVWIFQPRIGWGWHHPHHGWDDRGRGRGRGRGHGHGRD